MQKFLQSQKVQEEVAKPKKKATAKAKDFGNGDSKTKLRKSEKSKTTKEEEDVKKKTKGGKEGKKVKKEKKRKKRALNAPAMHFTAQAEPQVIDADLDPVIFSQCKEKMRPVKKALKKLDPDKKLSEEDRVKNTAQHLIKIGDRIMECLREVEQDEKKTKEWRNHLWTFVSKFTEFSPKRIYKMYRAIKKGEKPEKIHRNHKKSSSSRHSHSHKGGGDGFDEPRGSKRSKSGGGSSPPKRPREGPSPYDSHSSYPSSSSYNRGWSSSGGPPHRDDRSSRPKSGPMDPPRDRRSYPERPPNNYPNQTAPGFSSHQPSGYGYGPTQPSRGYGPPSVSYPSPNYGPASSFSDRGDWNRRPLENNHRNQYEEKAAAAHTSLPPTSSSANNNSNNNSNSTR